MLTHNLQLEDWYVVPRKKIKEMIVGGGAQRLFIRYKSLGEALKVAYPEYPWDLDSFFKKGTPRGYWQKSGNVEKALNRAENTLGITKV